MQKAMLEPKIKNGEVQLYEVGEIPPYWQELVNRAGIKVLQLAATFGYIIPEYTMRDYVEYAVEAPNGSETIDIWGKQGSMKSNRTLQVGDWVYGDWDTVIKEMVLMPDARGFTGYEDRGFLQKMQSIKKGECAPLISWDDLTVGMPSSSFKTDILVYAAIDSAWAAIRTKIKVVVLNNPLIDRIGKNIKDNVTIEVMIGPNQVELIERWIRLVGLRRPDSSFFKVQIEPLHKFDWRNVPTSVFKQYYDIRQEIADFAVHKMGKAFGDEAALLDDMVGMKQMWTESPVSLSSLSEMFRRGFIDHEKVNGRIYVKKSIWAEFLLREAEKRGLGRGKVRRI